jgi:branched-chain amino acid transport system permease protein
MSVSQVFLIAYGQFYMIGAYAVWYAVQLHVPYFLALLAGALATGILGILSYFLVFQRIKKMEGNFLATITAAMGLSLILGQGGLLIFGTYTRSIPTVFPGSNTIGGVIFQNDKIALIIMGIASIVLLFWLYEKTTIGRQMRSVSIMPEVSSLMGININRIYLITFGIGCGLAGFAGGIIAPSYGISAQMGNNIILTILLMNQLGGVDSLLGAVAGGLVVGLILSFGQYYIGGAIQIYLLLIIAVVIYFRPQGLLGYGLQIEV